MADVKISQLPTATVVNSSDILVLNQGGATKTAAQSLVVAGLATTSQVAAITTQQLSAISISAGTGLTGGGPLSANSTMAIAALSPNPAGTYGSSSQIPVLTVNQIGQITSVTTQANPNPVRTKVVGIDASTIQGCIDLLSDATYANPGQVLIPPGVYTENLTLRPSLLIAGIGQNNGLSGLVRVNGNHTYTGTSVSSDNQITISALMLSNTSAANPTLSFSTPSGVAALVNVKDCYIRNLTPNSTASVVTYVGPDVILRTFGVASECYSVAPLSGTHFDVNGGSLYAQNTSTEFGSCAILMRGTNGAYKPYAELLNCKLVCNGANVVNITSTTALLTAGWSAFSNLAATGNGFYVAAGSVVGAYGCNFAIQSGASNYVITGAVGSVCYQLNNGYSNATGAVYETKVDPLVAQFLYSSSTYCTGSKTYDAPSIAAGANTTTTVTCTGATTSHFAEAVLSTNTGLTLSAWVSSANTVTVRLTNQTASPIDATSGTLKVRASL